MTAPPPLTPRDCDLSGFSFMPWDYTRFRQSGLLASGEADEVLAAIMLYGEAWQSVPAGSLDNDDKALARAAGYGRSVKEWLKVKRAALRGWIECSDGRLYHPVVAEKAREAWHKKLEQRHRTFCAAVRKHNERNPTDRRASPNFDQWEAQGRPTSVSRDTRPAPQQGDLALPESEPPVRAPAHTVARAMPDDETDGNHEKSHATGDNVTRDAPPKSRVNDHPRESKGKGQGDSTEIVESPQAPLAVTLALEVAELAGVRLATDEARDTAIGEVQRWLADGIAPSTIKAAVVAFTAKARTPSRSLHRFDGDVRLHHARAPKARSAKAREIDAPVTLPDDPDPRIADLRSTLRRAVGPRTYDGWLRGSAFTLNGTGLIVTCPSIFMADWTESHLARQLADAAQQHGLGSVKITAIPLKG